MAAHGFSRTGGPHAMQVVLTMLYHTLVSLSKPFYYRHIRPSIQEQATATAITVPGRCAPRARCSAALHTASLEHATEVEHQYTCSISTSVTFRSPPHKLTSSFRTLPFLLFCYLVYLVRAQNFFPKKNNMVYYAYGNAGAAHIIQHQNNGDPSSLDQSGTTSVDTGRAATLGSAQITAAYCPLGITSRNQPGAVQFKKFARRSRQIYLDLRPNSWSQI